MDDALVVRMQMTPISRLRRVFGGVMASTLATGASIAAGGCDASSTENPDFTRTAVLQRDATCAAVDRDLSWQYSYKASTRILTESYQPRAAGGNSGMFESELDANGLSLWNQETQQGSLLWHHDNTYDDHGRLSHLEMGGSIGADYVNSYEASGRLAARETRPTGAVDLGPRPARQTYVYDDAGRLIRVLTDLLNDGSVDQVDAISYDSRNLRESVETYAPPTATTASLRRSFTYDTDGRVERADFDGGGPIGTGAVDGSIDARLSWTYRQGTDVAQLQKDVPPAGSFMLDGVPDDQTDYQQGCRAIGVLAPVIYSFPSELNWP